MAPILDVKNLSHVYSGGTPFEHNALTDISFRVERGEFIGIIGRTGSGKSTLIQHLNGLLKPTAGTVELDGKNIWSDKAYTRSCRFRVGLVFQYPEYQLFEDTVYKDISFGPRNMKLTQAETDRRVREAIGFVGLPESVLKMSPFELSGGQKRRVAIAGVIAMEPEILILDEPTAGLDPEGCREILANVDAYRKAMNATILMVSHSMTDVARMADRLLVMRDGKLAMDASPDEVFRHADLLTEMGLDVPQITKVFLLLQEMGLSVPRVNTVEEAVSALTRLTGGVNRD